MGRFSYKAVNRGGLHISGVIEAPDRRSAVAGLTDKGQFVIEVSEEGQSDALGVVDGGAFDFFKFLKFGSARIGSKDILAMTSQLSTALRAGLPLLNGLEIIRDQQHKPVMRQLLEELVVAVSAGQSLSEAMSEHSDVFSPLYISMVRVGETGGILEQTMGQLSSLISRDEKVKTSMKNASAYPIFVLSLGFISAVVVITWILPRVLETIGGEGALMPLPTRILMATGTFIKYYGWFVGVGAIVGGYYMVRWCRGTGRIVWDSFKLRIPVLGSVLRTIAVGRFARTLGSLTKGGVTILEALGVVRDTLGNEVLGREIDKMVEDVKTGSSLAIPLGSSGNFPPLLVQIVSVGEQTGKLDELLLNAADTFDEAADSAINRFIAVFPAVLILILALVIGFIIAATLLPIVAMELGGGAF